MILGRIPIETARVLSKAWPDMHKWFSFQWVFDDDGVLEVVYTPPKVERKPRKPKKS